MIYKFYYFLNISMNKPLKTGVLWWLMALAPSGTFANWNVANWDSKVKTEIATNFTNHKAEWIESERKKIEELKKFMMEFNKKIRYNISMVPWGSGSNMITVGDVKIYLSVTESSGSFGTTKKYSLNYQKGWNMIFVYTCTMTTNSIKAKNDHVNLEIKADGETLSLSWKIDTKNDYKIENWELTNYLVFWSAQSYIDEVNSFLKTPPATPEKE